MRSKTPLAMMEQLLMLLVFALAALVCLQVFVFSGQTSRRNEARDRAVLEAQNAAEELKSLRGDMALAAELYGGSCDGQIWSWTCDENWERNCGDTYRVLVTRSYSSEALLGAAQVTVSTAEGDLLFALPVAWQEVADHG